MWSVPMVTAMEQFSMRQILAVAPISRRTVRNWVRRGIVPPPVLRGPATVYPRQTLLAVSALCHLRAKGERFDEAAAKVTGASVERLEEILGIAATHAPAPEASASAVMAPEAPSTEPARVGDSWRRLRLLPGLELHLRDDAREVVRRIADEIVSRYAADG